MRRTALIFLFSLLFLILFPSKVLAATVSSGDINLHSWTQISLLDIGSSLTCQIIGYDPAKPDGAGCVAYNQGNLEKAEKPGGGAVAFTGNLIAALYANPPASGVQYLADLGKNLGIVKPAYAQMGTGWSGLSPIQPIWKAFRNIAYLFFTIVFIAIGFAIMFRVKISPQAVVTIQSAIPRIVIALILVTFSYAIAGFLIDLTYVLILLAIAFLGNAGVPSIGTGDIPGLQAQFTGGFLGTIAGVLQVVTWQLPVAFTLLGVIIGAAVGFFITIPVAGGGAIGGALAGGVLFLLIIAVTILFLLFKLFIELLKAYISIIVLVIFGPLQIAIGAIPGQSGFGSWFRGLLANILVFPAVAIFLLIGRSLMSLTDPLGKGLWTPPMFGFPSQVLPAIIALGILFMVTKVPEMVKEALKVSPFKYGAAIGEAVGVVYRPARAGALYGVSELERQLPQGRLKSAAQAAKWFMGGRP